MKTKATELVGAEAPLFGFNRSPAVVVAVTRAGGVGVLPAHHYAPDELDRVLGWIDERVDGRPYGIDLVVPPLDAGAPDRDALVARMRADIPAEHWRFVDELLDRHGVGAELDGLPEHGRLGPDEAAAGVDPAWIEPLLDVAFSHPIRLVANALGTPPPILRDRARAHGVPVAALVGSAKHARRQLDAGVDILVAQGYEAGGHTGDIATMVLTPEVIAEADGVPVLAAGGIASGAQMAAALALGAEGAWCGSVWLSSHEDITVEPIKRKFLEASSADTLRSRTRTGKPARQLRSVWHDAWETEGAPEPLGLPLQLMLTNGAWDRIDAAALRGQHGALELESFFIGQVVGAFRELRPAEDIARTMIEDCRAVLERLGRLAGTATP